jgi:hypothetical protein
MSNDTPAAPAPEPVSEVTNISTHSDGTKFYTIGPFARDVPVGTKLYAHPAPVAAPDAEEIMALADGYAANLVNGEPTKTRAALRAAVERVIAERDTLKAVSEKYLEQGGINLERAEKAEQDAARLREEWPKVRALLMELKAARDSGRIPYSHATDIQIGPLVAAIDAAMKEPK